MQLTSVNIGTERALHMGDREMATGIYKVPVLDDVEVRSLGLVGDVVKDTRHHGGLDQAVYVYGGADYAWWEGELRAPFAPGSFGENLTLSDLETAGLCVGDRLLFENVTLEVTAPRIPCGTLSAKLKRADFVKRFREARRPGAYCRVIKSGTIRRGTSVRLDRCGVDSLSLGVVFDEYYQADKLKEAELRRYLEAPIAVRTREVIEKMLEKFQ